MTSTRLLHRCGLVLGLMALLALPALAGQRDLDGRWGLGLEGGAYKLIGGEVDYSTVDQVFGFHVDHALSRRWILQAAIRYGHTRPGVASRDDGDVGWSGASGAPLYTPMWQPMLRLQHRFSPYSSVQPFLGVGVGMTSWKVVNKQGEDVGLIVNDAPEQGFDSDGRPATLKGKDFTLGFELGVDIAMSDRLALTAGSRLHLMPGNDLDNVGMSSFWGPDYVDANTASIEGYLGLTLWFGSSDRDRDGVLNGLDGCPLQAEDLDGFQDDDGCPELDNDGDGIADLRDACMNEAEDHDGFQDLDGCPEPDNDGDGVADAQDRCPEEAEDMDGFQDDDGCPDPDNDGDGVVDDVDQCPDTPAGAQVGADGCERVAVPTPSPVPVVAAPAAAAMVLPVAGQTIVLDHVTFESGSARLTSASNETLNALATALADAPEAVVEVRGHTDATGPDEANLDLSQRRAGAVRDALIRRGVAPGRITAVGYGESFPIGDNSTAAGRAANRRVELHRLQ